MPERAELRCRYALRSRTPRSFSARLTTFPFVRDVHGGYTGAAVSRRVRGLSYDVGGGASSTAHYKNVLRLIVASEPSGLLL
jgi:hypothetical protein